MFESQLLESLKADFGITTKKHNQTIKKLIKQYIKGEISKENLTDTMQSLKITN